MVTTSTKKPVRVLDPTNGTVLPGGLKVVAPEGAVTITLPPKDILEGKLSKISGAVTAISGLCLMFGWHLPSNEINGVFTWVMANYDSLGVLIGMLGSIYGQIRRLFRKPAVITVNS